MSTLRQNRDITVMIADDNEGILDVMRTMLEMSGYTVVTTNDGRTLGTLSLLKTPLPDVLFLDIMLSGTDGRELCKELKHNKKTRKMPICMLSANSTLAKIANECGADGYLPKPFDMPDLLELVERHTKTK